MFSDNYNDLNSAQRWDILLSMVNDDMKALFQTRFPVASDLARFVREGRIPISPHVDRELRVAHDACWHYLRHRHAWPFE